MHTNTDRSINVVSKLTQVCRNLRPFQTFEYDPNQGHIQIVTEWSIPTNQQNQLCDIIAGRKADEKISVRRFDHSFKLAIVKSIQL